MTNSEIFESIERGCVRADLRLASTDYALLRRLDANPVLREAQQRIAVSPEDVVLFLERAVIQRDHNVAPGFRSPRDLALAAYIFVLGRFPGRGVQRFITGIAQSGRHDLSAALVVAGYFISQTSTSTGTPSRSERLSRFIQSRDVATDYTAVMEASSGEVTFTTGGLQVVGLV